MRDAVEDKTLLWEGIGGVVRRILDLTKADGTYPELRKELETLWRTHCTQSWKKWLEENPIKLPAPPYKLVDNEGKDLRVPELGDEFIVRVQDSLASVLLNGEPIGMFQNIDLKSEQGVVRCTIKLFDHDGRSERIIEKLRKLPWMEVVLTTVEELGGKS